MTPKASRVAWPAQIPDGDFADRTVAAILRDRAAGRTPSRPLRTWAVIAVATVLFAGGAWARIALPRARASFAPRSVSTPEKGTPAGPSSAPEPHAAVRELPAEPPRALPPQPTGSPRRPRERDPSADAGRRVRVPMCNCVQAICDCGEEP